MLQDDRVPNESLLHAGLELMRQAGKPLIAAPTKGRSMIYAMSNGETVRVRTCNDHILVVLADHEGEDAKLNIEGTTHILFVMPRKARTHGLVDAYFLPTAVVADAARTTHRQWLQTQPGSNGNRTWNLWFSDKKSPKAENYSGFARKWAAYRLPGEFGTDGVLVTSPNVPLAPASSLKLGDVIAAAKRQIADVAGVSPEAVRISVDLA